MQVEVFSIGGSGALYINLANGSIAAVVSVSLDTGNAIPGFSVNGTATLQFNTGETPIDTIAGVPWPERLTLSLLPFLSRVH